MNSSAAENFINSLVRNLQVLCHSNVEFDDDIEVVGHLYLKVDKAKKFNYIVDEKVCKNDASSTVFVSNSYHSCNQNKTNDTDSDIHKPNQDTISSPRDTSNGGSSKRDANKSLIHFSNSFTNDEPPSKSQRLNVSLSSQDVNKSFKPRIKHTFNRNTTQIPPKLKTEEPDHIDLTKIKSEPPDDVTENLNCYFESPGKSHNSSENESRANITDTGQLNDDEFFANIKEKAFGIHPVALIPNELSQSGHESLSHYSQASTSASNFNLHNPDLSQSSDAVSSLMQIHYTAEDLILATSKAAQSMFSLILRNAADSVGIWRTTPKLNSVPQEVKDEFFSIICAPPNEGLSDYKDQIWNILGTRLIHRRYNQKRTKYT
ncbi:uncharacterized protein LOC126816062 isoform X2 [Patella vulgata]|uniref:uncharacterized protein LOC126816062 isoform X2 n=1 Tax=Patella vulgata TaxID=6465 RepID=UPI00217F3311|nr:uncharacterized protein LOC126816062 isoform X2 [Patella vulgata]